MATLLKARMSFNYPSLFPDTPPPKKNLHHHTTFFISMDKKLNWLFPLTQQPNKNGICRPDHTLDNTVKLGIFSSGLAPLNPKVLHLETLHTPASFPVGTIHPFITQTQHAQGHQVKYSHNSTGLWPRQRQQAGLKGGKISKLARWSTTQVCGIGGTGLISGLTTLDHPVVSLLPANHLWHRRLLGYISIFKFKKAN